MEVLLTTKLDVMRGLLVPYKPRPPLPEILSESSEGGLGSLVRNFRGVMRT